MDMGNAESTRSGFLHPHPFLGFLTHLPVLPIIFLKIGACMRHGPHQAAQKSTKTKPLLFLLQMLRL